jgi:hypothetical protein
MTKCYWLDQEQQAEQPPQRTPEEWWRQLALLYPKDRPEKKA